MEADLEKVKKEETIPVKASVFSKTRTESPVERTSKRKREVKAESKAKLATETSSKRKQVWREDSSS
jgi:hypothetical protein